MTFTSLFESMAFPDLIPELCTNLPAPPKMDYMYELYGIGKQPLRVTSCFHEAGY